MELKLLFLLAFIASAVCDVGVSGARKLNCNTAFKIYRNYVRRYKKLKINYYRHRMRYRGLLASYRRFQALVFKLSSQLKGPVGKKLRQASLRHLRLISYYGDEDGEKDDNKGSGVVNEFDIGRLSDFEEENEKMKEAEKTLRQGGEETELDESSPTTNEENIST